MIINKIATILTINNEAADKIMIALKDSELALENTDGTYINVFQIEEDPHKKN